MSGLILAVVVLVAAVALIVWLARSVRWEPVHVEFREPGEPATAMRQWASDYADWFAAGRYRPTGRDSTTLTYTRTYIPNFAILCAILLFPLGLVALLARRDATMLVSFRDDGSGGAAVAVTGTAQRKAAQAFRQLAEQP
jgi:hypothetical protein